MQITGSGADVLHMLSSPDPFCLNRCYLRSPFKYTPVNLIDLLTCQVKLALPEFLGLSNPMVVTYACRDLLCNIFSINTHSPQHTVLLWVFDNWNSISIDLSPVSFSILVCLDINVYNTVIGEDGNRDDGERSWERNNNGDVELPTSRFYGETESEDAGSQSNETSTSNGNNADSNEVEIRTGKGGKKTVRIRRSAVNPLCFKDMMAEGMAKLESRNLPIRRFRRFARE